MKTQLVSRNTYKNKNDNDTFTCFSCGEKISFKNKDGKSEYTKNRFGKFVKKRFNLDGSFHVCQNKKQTSSSNYNYSSGFSSRSKAFWRWYWGFGPGRYHKKNWDRYSGEDYQNRRKDAEDARSKWKERYSRNWTAQNRISVDEALTRLGLFRDVLQKNFEERLKEIKTAYRKLALRFHPDRVQGEENKKVAHEQFILINEAYEVLTK